MKKIVFDDSAHCLEPDEMECMFQMATCADEISCSPEFMTTLLERCMINEDLLEMYQQSQTILEPIDED